MEITIEAYANLYIVKVNGKVIGEWTYQEGAIEAVKKELEARYKETAIKCTCFAKGYKTSESEQKCAIHGVSAQLNRSQME